MSQQGKTVMMVCFANSWKHHERCVAGKVWGSDAHGKWVRPVGAAPTGELTLRERSVAGREPRLLELIELSLGSPAPHSCHREDHRIAPSVPWRSCGRLRPADAVTLCDPIAPLWANGFHRQNDRMPVRVADQQAGSLRLIRVERPEWTWRNTSGASKGRLAFLHAGEHYDLSVTDPEAVRLEPAHMGVRVLPGAHLLCISVGEPFQGEMFKLVAGILPLSEDRR